MPVTGDHAFGALLAAEQALGEVLLDARDGTEAFLGGMGATAAGLGWTQASLWLTRADGTVTLVLQWPADGVATPRTGLTTTLGARGAGAVAVDGAPRWFGDPATDPQVVRGADLAADGVRSGVFFPLEGARRVAAVVEAGFPDERAGEPAVDATLVSLGRRVGQFVEQQRAHRASRRNEARKEAILAAALDVIITIDEDGLVVEANPALERVFGFDPVAVVGREMAALIVPPELQGAHREGLRRLIGGGEPRLLGRRTELEAVRADGSRVPVELTVTRIDVPGPPLFTGHVRDITAVKEAAEALRASRARVVEASDAARRRIERDLHDGAQQRLVGLALTLRLIETQLDRDPEGARQLLAEAREELSGATDELRELARGIHPALLTQAGLDAAVTGLVRRSPVPVDAELGVGVRLPGPVEAAAYFAIAEALANVARHSGATAVRVSTALSDGALRFAVADDGCGGVGAGRGSGLSGLADRLAAVDGVLAVDSPPGGGTRLEGVVPLPGPG